MDTDPDTNVDTDTATDTANDTNIDTDRDTDADNDTGQSTDTAERARGRGESTSQSWCALRRRVQRLHDLQMPELARFPLTLQAVANVGAPLPSAAVLDECIVHLKRLAAAQVQREDRERVQAWQAEWGTKPGAVYRWLKEEAFSPPVVFIARPDGTPRANVREMDELVRAAWGPINRKYAEGPESCPEAFLAKYGHLHRVPM